MEEYEKNLLKLEIKDEIHEELVDLISETMKGLIGPAVSERIGALLEYPLTVRQMASLAGRSEACIYKMCQRGQIPFSKVGSKIYINLKDVNGQLLGPQRLK